jgi:adenylate cyclase
MNADRINSWLLREARSLPDLKALSAGLMDQFRAEGLEFVRFSIGYQTLHPEVAALAFYWDHTMEEVQEINVGIETQASTDYLVSPVRVIHEGGDMVRCRLEGDDPEMEYEFLEGLRDKGYTDYLMLGVPLPGGRYSPMGLGSKTPGGFTDEQISALRGIRDLLGLHVEIHASHHLAGTLLDVYLGHGTGERVLAGAIRRGTVQRYPAALCFCDLRGFTALSERLPRNYIIHVLNDYFGAVGKAIEENGGEILKFIGDAALAVFPADKDGTSAACDRAFSAGQSLLANLAELNEERRTENKPPLEIGMGLHVGDVWYGNIGASNRLDFTVIGPAVNRAARLEKLASDLGETILVSEDFNAAAAAGFDRVGAYELKGIEGLTPAYRPS